MNDLARWLDEQWWTWRTSERVAELLLAIPEAERAALVGIDLPVVEISQPLPDEPLRFNASTRVEPYLQLPADLTVTNSEMVITAKVMPGTLVYRLRGAVPASGKATS